jgi:D-lactate dehydrogenase
MKNLTWNPFMQDAFDRFFEDISVTLPAHRLITDPLTTLAYGTDASFYRLTPQLVITVNDLEEMKTVLIAAHRHQIALTFRAAGTSLSGQAVTDSVLVRLGEGWQNHQLHGLGEKISLQPGIIGAQANKLLSLYGRKIGPDPASIDTAKIGGIAANNASGMCCGVAQNSYHTLHSMQLLLADGSYLDTACEQSKADFQKTHTGLLSELAQLAKSVQSNRLLAEKIQRKYRIKNTTGYGLNALLDHTDPVEILQHLMIGSEGTLGFMAQVTYNTVVDPKYKSSTFLCFESVEAACDAVMVLKQAAVAAVELMDNSALQSIRGMPGVPEFIENIDDTTTALLVDVRGEQQEQLAAKQAAVELLCAGLPLLWPCHFSQTQAQYQSYWKVRKGLFPAVGANRPKGTTVIIEDVAFPVETLAAAVLELQALLRKHAYHEAIIFGHALEGNLHFVFCQAFDSPEEVARYDAFMQDVAHLVVEGYQGSLKAEHGTGRNMAPFVKHEWGEEAYEVMWKIKSLLDPNNILNPGVLLNRDQSVHLKNLKPMAPVSDLIDKCIECGFCEPSCPSRALTLTPRQRIAAQREMARLGNSSLARDAVTLAQMQKAYDYSGDETCAACGLCQVACPVDINTGDLTRWVRQKKHTKIAHWLASRVAKNMSTIFSSLRVVLMISEALQRCFGAERLKRASQYLRKFSGHRLPLWLVNTPRHNGVYYYDPALEVGPDAANLKGSKDKTANKVVYYSSCANRNMEAADASGQQVRSVQESTLSVLKKAGFTVVFPSAQQSLCCGMPFFSKGFPEQGQHLCSQVNEALLQASEQGRWPIICDMSPCSSQLKEGLDGRLDLWDSVSFVTRHALAQLAVAPTKETIALHIPCSVTRMGQAEDMTLLAKACAEQVVIPEAIACCGFAGDKGFTSPELNQSALAGLNKQLPVTCLRGVSSSRTCEIGLTEYSGRPYGSLITLLDEVSKAPVNR